MGRERRYPVGFNSIAGRPLGGPDSSDLTMVLVPGISRIGTRPVPLIFLLTETLISGNLTLYDRDFTRGVCPEA